MSGDISHINHRERYSIYNTKDARQIEFKIDGIVGDYKISKYQLNRESGSVFDEWTKMGLPENMTGEEIDYLKGKAKPKIMVDHIQVDGLYTDGLIIPVHGVELILLEKQY